jgi:hypothetical protein
MYNITYDAKQARIWKEMIKAYLKVLLWYSPAETEVNHRKPP